MQFAFFRIFFFEEIKNSIDVWQSTLIEIKLVSVLLDKLKSVFIEFLKHKQL